MSAQHRRYSRRQAILAGLAALGAGAGVGALRPGLALAGTSDGAASAAGAETARLVEATRRFGFRLFGTLVAAQPHQNVFLSPSSVATTLTVAYNGARGATRQAMAATLGLQGMSMAAVNRASAVLAATLAGLDPHVALTEANALWARRGIAFNPAFVQLAAHYYGARTTVLDFTSPSAPAVVNAWVSRETHGKITAIVDTIPADTVMFISNAVYFKGRWTAPFDPSRTQPGPFALPGGGQKSLPMMAQTGRYPYYSGPNFQAISLPYGSGKWTMLVVLPDEGTSLGELQRGLSAATWETWLARLRSSYGSISLPRFTVDYSADLRAPLAALGMSVAFDRMQADFGAMVPDQRAFINMVAHKAVMTVDEEGTTAAATTGLGVSITAVEEPQFEMVVNRPFLCAIQDSVSGTVLFLGAIVDPS